MEPLDKLKLMSAWDAEPTISEDHLEAMMAEFALDDSLGRIPSDLDWTPTYDLNAAAAEAWLIKAAAASMLTEVDPPGSGIVTSKVFDNCRAMTRMYAAKRAVCVSVR